MTVTRTCEIRTASCIGMFGHPCTTKQHAQTKTPKGLRFTGICVHVHLRNPEATHRLWERLTFSSQGLEIFVCSHSLHHLLSSINPPISVCDRTENKTQEKKGKGCKRRDVYLALLWLMSSSDKQHSPENRANKKYWDMNLMYKYVTCLSLQKYTVFAFCFCYTYKF